MASPNKLNQRQKENAEKLKSRLQTRYGKDEASKQAYRQAAQQPGGQGGGRNASGEAQKATKTSRSKRPGSQSNASK